MGEAAHFLWIWVKDEGNWSGWMGFLRKSGETLCCVVGSSWLRLMICRASWVFPEDQTQHSRIRFKMPSQTQQLSLFPLFAKPTRRFDMWDTSVTNQPTQGVWKIWQTCYNRCNWWRRSSLTILQLQVHPQQDGFRRDLLAVHHRRSLMVTAQI